MEFYPQLNVSIKPSILVVDDTRDNLRLLSRMLTEQGYKVRPAPDGRRAILSAQSKPPDLILLDIMMPEMDGYTVCKSLKEDEQTKDIPVIFLSALNETVDKVRAFQVGGVDYITKPFQAEEVLARVSTHLELAAMRKRLEEHNTLLSEEIIEHKRTKAELQRARDVADAANKAKSVFLANMSHELRSPLTAILGFVQVMARSSTLPSEHHENVDIIRRSGEHLLMLINQVLELSKIEAGRIMMDENDVDLYRLLEDMENMFRLRMQEKQLQFLVKKSENVPQYLRTDEVKLRQVLINLLNNALKFTKEGNVQLSVTSKQASEHEKRSILKPEHAPVGTDCCLLFTVKDTGPGIAQEEIDGVFEAFVQTESGRQTQEGTGLGLPISRKFVQLMGGDMQVTSKMGHGTLFTFEIQVRIIKTADLEQHLLPHRVIALEPGQPQYRIVVVDDRLTNRQLVVKLLTPLGFDLREATNGAEAVELCRTWEPHLIWMDMRMPVMDGYKATEEIRRWENKRFRHLHDRNPQLSTLQSHIKIIALTASSFEEDRTRILSTGCDDYLRKPFLEEELFALLSKHLGVKFIYEEEKAPDLERRKVGRDTMPLLSSEALSELPSDWLINLKQGAEEANIDLLSSTIEQIRDQDAALADVLAHLAEDFEYDKILSIFT